MRKVFPIIFAKIINGPSKKPSEMELDISTNIKFLYTWFCRKYVTKWKNWHMGANIILHRPQVWLSIMNIWLKFFCWVIGKSQPNLWQSCKLYKCQISSNRLMSLISNWSAISKLVKNFFVWPKLRKLWCWPRYIVTAE